MKATSGIDELAPQAKQKTGVGRSVVGILSGVIIIALGIAVAYYLVGRKQNPLTTFLVTELESVTFVSPSDSRPIAVYPQRWSDLLRNFRSSVSYWNTTKWKSLTTITFKLKDGREFLVDVYETRRDTGCFRIGKVYYAGGDELFLSRLMNDMVKRSDR